MRALALALILLAVLQQATATAQEAPTNDLARLRSVYDSRVLGIVVKYATAASNAPAEYGRALDALERSTQQAGDLIGLLAVKKERERFSVDIGVPGDDQPDDPPSLKDLKARYRQASLKRNQARLAETAALTQAYRRRLEELRRDLTIRGELTSALDVQTEIERTEGMPAGRQVPIAPVSNSATQQVETGTRATSPSTTTSTLRPLQKSARVAAYDLGVAMSWALVHSSIQSQLTLVPHDVDNAQTALDDLVKWQVMQPRILRQGLPSPAAGILPPLAKLWEGQVAELRGYSVEAAATYELGHWLARAEAQAGSPAWGMAASLVKGHLQQALAVLSGDLRSDHFDADPIKRALRLFETGVPDRGEANRLINVAVEYYRASLAK